MLDLERVLDIYGPTLFKEGERFAKIKTDTLFLEILLGSRRVILAYFHSLVFTVFFTASTFALVLYAVMMYARTGTLQLDAFFVFSFFVWIISFGMASWFLREKRWLKAFDIQSRLDELQNPIMAYSVHLKAN